jgi:hypothetical protein
LGESKGAAIGYEPDEPEDAELDELGFFADEADLRADELDLRDVGDFRADELDFFAVERDDDDLLADELDFLAAERDDLRADELDFFAVERAFLAVERFDAGLRAALEALLRAAPLPPSGPTSSAATRFASPSTSARSPFSSSRTRSSSTSRMRFAAAVTSFARPRVDLAPSAEAEKVRSTAARTASTASAAPAAALSFLPDFFEFLAMAARS